MSQEASATPQLFGYALDGYPIYSGNFQYKSSWKLTNQSRFSTDTWSAHTYVAGSGDLDQCNGRTDARGNYAHYTTDAFPYVMGCFKGHRQRKELRRQRHLAPLGRMFSRRDLVIGTIAESTGLSPHWVLTPMLSSST